MRTKFMRLLLLMILYYTVLSAIPAPVNFKILSHNFNHILQWSPGINSPPQTVFNLKQSCSPGKPIVTLNIRNTTVDVSKSLEDIYKLYTFFVWASLGNMTSSRVKIRITPYEDTVIGPPTVFLSGCGDCLKIHISLPRGSGKKDQLDQFYNSVSFNISWKKAGEKKVNQILISGEQHVLQNLNPGEKYCIRVVPQINSNRNTRLSAWQCEYTSKEESREVLYLVGWSLGAVLFGLGVMVLAGILFYIGCLCKMKMSLPKALSNIVKVYYLNPEQTDTEGVLLTDNQLNQSKNDPTIPLLNPDWGSHKAKHEDKDNFCQKADTEDEEEYDQEDEDDNCTYMSRIMNHSGFETSSIEKNCIVSALPCHTEDNRALHLSVTTLSSHIHNDEDEFKKEVIEKESKVTGEKNELREFTFKLEGNADESDAVGNVNLFSVTLRPLGTEEDEKDLDEEGVCEPLLPKPLVNKHQEDFYRITPSVQTERKTDDLITEGTQIHLPVRFSEPDIQNNPDTMSGNTVTLTGNMHEQNICLSEETDNCDTGYMTR